MRLKAIYAAIWKKIEMLKKSARHFAVVADHERLLPKFLLKSFSVKAADFIAMSVLLMAARAREVDAGRAAKVNQVWNLLF